MNFMEQREQIIVETLKKALDSFTPNLIKLSNLNKKKSYELLDEYNELIFSLERKVNSEIEKYSTIPSTADILIISFIIICLLIIFANR
jgi:hypothetical protein